VLNGDALLQAALGCIGIAAAGIALLVAMRRTR
jgi:hypothetical protein